MQFLFFFVQTIDEFDFDDFEFESTKCYLDNMQLKEKRRKKNCYAFNWCKHDNKKRNEWVPVLWLQWANDAFVFLRCQVQLLNTRNEKKKEGDREQENI